MVNTDYLRVYWALVMRNVIVLQQRYRGALIDAGIPLMVEVIVFGSLFPLMGVPLPFIGSIYLGAQTMSIFFIIGAFGFRNVFDLQYSRFIDYRLTLPLPKRWLFATYITYYVMEAFIVSIPLLTLGIMLLGSKFQAIQPHWFLFIVIYLMALCLYSLLFLGLSFHYEFHWYLQNIWPRRLSILLALSPIFYNWYAAYAFSPKIAYVMLLNPLTYVAEGLRTTLIGGPHFISPAYCILALAIWIGISILFLAKSIYKRLDPV